MKEIEFGTGHAGAHGSQRFLQFVRHVAPDADPTSVMLFGQLMHASNLLVQAAQRNLKHPGLTWAKFRLLMSLHRAEALGELHGTQPSQLSDLQGISRNTVSALIASLEKDGLIRRALHESDRRCFLIHLTPEGRKLLKSKMVGQFQFVSACFEEFSPEERESLARLLVRLNARLLSQNKSVSPAAADSGREARAGRRRGRRRGEPEESA